MALGPAVPAAAQGGTADLEISLAGTTVTEGVAGKFGTLTLTNHGPQDATGIEFTYDLTGLDSSKVELVLEDCPAEAGIAECVLVPDGLVTGEHATFFDLLQVVPGATGDAGSITMSITHAGSDPDPTNNQVTADVRIEGSGADLLVFAPDVHDEARIEFAAGNTTITDFEFLDTPVVPGSDAVVFVLAANQGNQPTSGIEMSITLPEHVSFTFPEPECSHGIGDSSTTCQYSTIVLTPGFELSDDCEELGGACLWFAFPVRISEDAPSPASLTGGSADAWDMQLGQLFSDPTAVEHPSSLAVTPPVDVDPTDNVSDFTVFVSELPAEPGGGGGELGDGSLPVTGVPAVLIGGAGVAVLAAGVLLFLAARRRRVVLAAPETDG
jgi:hypothetical protein